MFKNAIVKIPCASLTRGITSHPELGSPDYGNALKQHASYIKTLEACGLSVTVLPASEAFPDSCFVEDPALLTPEAAIITRPGAITRRDETVEMENAVKDFYAPDAIKHITAPGTLEGGDVMECGKTFYVGVSARTNMEGIKQLTDILAPFGYSVVPVPLKSVLHLKTGVAYLGNNTILAAGEFLSSPVFEDFKKVPVPDDEDYAANSVEINGTIVVPAGYPKTQEAIEAVGFKTVTCDTSEFKKLDGGLSCLSLRF